MSNESNDCGCGVKKIELKPSCSGTKHFEVSNYFSELVHDWEKEAARYNLGIQELESIRYYTKNDPETQQLLSKVVFTYRQGHEYKIMEFDVAPRGEKGERGSKGDNGLSAYEIAKILGFTGSQAEWIQSLKGETPVISEITVDYTATNQGYGECEQINGTGNKYKLKLHLVAPTLDTTQLIIDLRSAWGDFYCTKGEVYTKKEVDALLGKLQGKYEGLLVALNSLGLTYDNEND